MSALRNYNASETMTGWVTGLEGRDTRKSRQQQQTQQIQNNNNTYDESGCAIVPFVGILVHFNLAHVIQDLFGQPSLKIRVMLDLHRQPFHRSIPSYSFNVTDSQTNQQVHQENRHE